MTELTVYNNNLALISEKKKVNLVKGRNQVKYSGVPSSLNPDTVFLTGDADLLLRQYSFKHEELTPGNLLKNSLGCSVRLISKDGDMSTGGIKAIVAGNKEGAVFSIDGKMLVGFDGQAVFDAVPDTMSIKPEIALDIDAENDNDNAEINLHYLAGGLSWKTHYTAKLDVSEKFDLTAFVSITNNSGASFNGADVSLVAGDVNTAQPYRENRAFGMEKSAVMKSSVSQAASSGVADDVYHRYSLAEKVDLADKETKRFLLFDEKNIPYEKEYVVELMQSDRLSAVYKNINPAFNAVFYWKNDDFVLPKGVVRGYAVAGDNVVFVGESNIKNTASGEKTILNFGKVFDVSVDVKYLITAPAPKLFKKSDASSYAVNMEVVIRNAKKEDIVVIFRRRLHPAVKVTSENYKSVVNDGGQKEWRVPVASGCENKLTIGYMWQELDGKIVE